MFNDLNHFLFLKINQFASTNKLLDLIAIYSAEYLQYLSIFTILLILILANKKIKFIAALSLSSFILARIISYIIQKIYFHPRPFMDGLGNNILAHSSKTSFPSSHTTFMLSVAFILLCFKETRVIGIVLSLLGFITGIARIYCGVHYPVDIFGATFIAFLSSYIVYKNRGRFITLHSTIMNLFKK